MQRDGEHKAFLPLVGIVAIKSSNKRVCKTLTKVVSMLEIVPTLHENSCAK